MLSSDVPAFMPRPGNSRRHAPARLSQTSDSGSNDRSHAFLSVRYNTRSSLGEASSLSSSVLLPWKGDLHAAIQPFAVVGCCNALADVVQMFRVTHDGQAIIDNIRLLLPVAGERLPASRSLALPQLFIDLQSICIILPHSGSDVVPLTTDGVDSDVVVVQVMAGT